MSFFKSLDAGVYEVKACYYNYFGDGAFSGSQTVTVKATIDGSLIEAGSVAAEKLDAVIKNNIANATANANAALNNSKITADKLAKDYSTTKQTETLIATRVASSMGNYSTTEQTANMISNSIANFKNNTLSQYSTIKQTEALISSQVASYTDGKLSGYSTIEQTNTAISNMVVKMDAATNKKLESYSTIQQTQDAISLAVKNIDLDGNDIITKINIADGTIKLDGKYVHITGDTQFDGNIITKNMLQAGCVDASKMNVESLSAITARIGELKTADTGARTVIKDNQIEVYDNNDILRVFIGVKQ